MIVRNQTHFIIKIKNQENVIAAAGIR